MSKITNNIITKTNNLIYKLSVTLTSNIYEKHCYHLDYDNKLYREKELIKLLNKCLPFFALTPQEFSKFKNSNDFGEAISLSWSRISSTDPLKKGDYGELLLFLLLEIFYPARKFLTKVRLRTSQGDQVKGFDCAHFSIENEEPVLWLGEAKFYSDFNNALNKSITSLNLHLEHSYINKEIDILAANVEYNYLDDGEFDESFEILDNYLNSGIAIDRFKFKIPILLTYDSTCINNNQEIHSAFIDELCNEIDKLSDKIDSKTLTTSLNVEFIFILFPLKSIAWIKSELSKLELISKEYV